MIFVWGKDVENRSRATRHRGPLVIHAAQRMTRGWRTNRATPLEHRSRNLEPSEAFTPGILLGVVSLTACVWSVEETGSDWAVPGVWHWMIRDPVPFVGQVLWKGRQGMWKLPLRELPAQAQRAVRQKANGAPEYVLDGV
jgi:hypothetical protein